MHWSYHPSTSQETQSPVDGKTMYYHKESTLCTNQLMKLDHIFKGVTNNRKSFFHHWHHYHI